MEDNSKLFETLLERATEYGKTSFELAKLKTIDKVTDVISTFVPHSIVIILLASFMIFLNLGLAIWLGKIMGEVFYGFFAVAAFYGFASILFHFILHKPIKNKVSESIIKNILN